MNSMHALADEMSLWGFERDFTIFDDGSLGFGLKLNPADISCYSDEATNDLKTKISQFLNSLPSGIDLQTG